MVGTDVLHGALLTGTAAIAHLVLGHVDFGLTAALLVGSVPGVLVGTHFAVRVPDRALRLTVGFVLLLAGVRLVA